MKERRIETTKGIVEQVRERLAANTLSCLSKGCFTPVVLSVLPSCQVKKTDLQSILFDLKAELPLCIKKLDSNKALYQLIIIKS